MTHSATADIVRQMTSSRVSLSQIATSDDVTGDDRVIGLILTLTAIVVSARTAVGVDPVGARGVIVTRLIQTVVDEVTQLACKRSQQLLLRSRYE